jgi:rare lipoprotein A
LAGVQGKEVRVDKILAAILASFIGFYPMKQSVLASFYGVNDGYHGRVTASGEVFDTYGLTMASPGRPLGSSQLLYNPANGRWVVVRVNDRGPYRGNRTADLSYEAARLLRTIEDGVAQLRIRQVDETSLAIIYGLDPTRRTP